MKYRFIGDAGAFLPGIPARDVTSEELTPEQRAEVEANAALVDAEGQPAAGRIYERADAKAKAASEGAD